MKLSDRAARYAAEAVSQHHARARGVRGLGAATLPGLSAGPAAAPTAVPSTTPTSVAPSVPVNGSSCVMSDGITAGLYTNGVCVASAPVVSTPNQAAATQAPTAVAPTVPIDGTTGFLSDGVTACVYTGGVCVATVPVASSNTTPVVATPLDGTVCSMADGSMGTYLGGVCMSATSATPVSVVSAPSIAAVSPMADGQPCSLPDGSAGGTYYQGACVAPGDSGSVCTMPDGTQGIMDEMVCTVPDGTPCTAGDGTAGSYYNGTCGSNTTGFQGSAAISSTGVVPAQLTTDANGNVIQVDANGNPVVATPTTPSWVTFLQDLLAIRSGQGASVLAPTVASPSTYVTSDLPAQAAASGTTESF